MIYLPLRRPQVLSTHLICTQGNRPTDSLRVSVQLYANYGPVSWSAGVDHQTSEWTGIHTQQYYQPLRAAPNPQLRAGQNRWSQRLTQLRSHAVLDTPGQTLEALAQTLRSDLIHANSTLRHWPDAPQIPCGPRLNTAGQGAPALRLRSAQRLLPAKDMALRVTSPDRQILLTAPATHPSLMTALQAVYAAVTLLETPLTVARTARAQLDRWH